MYEEFDQQLVDAIGRGVNKFFRLECVFEKRAAEIAKLTYGRTGFRVIDGRLQSLKKRGLIRFKGGKWEVCK